MAVEAVRQTEKANRAKIAWQLGAIGQKIDVRKISRGKNKGQMRVKKGQFITSDSLGRQSFAARILGARFRLTGQWGVRGNTMEERIHNLISSAQRSAAFIASGWIGARNALWSIVRKKPAGLMSIAGVRQYGKPKGAARPATLALASKIQAEIVNTALQANEGQPPAPGGDPMPVATRGLQQALSVAARDMMDELARRLNPDFRAVSKH